MFQKGDPVLNTGIDIFPIKRDFKWGEVEKVVYPNYIEYFKKLTNRTPDNPTIFGSLSTVVGDEKLTSREDLIGLLFCMFRVMKTRFLKLMKFLKPKPKRLMSLINLLVASSFAFE